MRPAHVPRSYLVRSVGVRVLLTADSADHVGSSEDEGPARRSVMTVASTTLMKLVVILVGTLSNALVQVCR